MIVSLFADLTLLLHFLWILFIVFGVLLALKGYKLAWLHLGGIVFSLLINVMGYYCPLTYLENYLHSLAGHGSGYKGSFMGHFLEKIIYPDISEYTLRWAEIVFAMVNLTVYGLVLRRFLLRRRPFLKT